MASVYFSQGRKSEQLFHEDLVVEAINIYGQEFFYIPRVLVAKDEILGEDRLSQFKTAYGIDMYLETVDGFEGQGAFIQKFGLMMEQSATLTVARRKWEQLIGRYGNTIIPTRPNEGDLLYFPLTGGLFEIKFVTHQDPFYQIGKLFVYKLQVELFQYASEKIRTGYDAIDNFESLKTFDIEVLKNGKVTEVYVSNPGFGYETAPTLLIGTNWVAATAVTAGQQYAHGTKHYIVTKSGTTGSSGPVHASGLATNGTAEFRYTGTRATATCTVLGDGTVSTATVTSSGSGYTSNPPVYAIEGGGSSTVIVAVIDNIDDQDSFGDNNKFKEEAAGVLFSEDNPFGEIVSSNANTINTADDSQELASSTTSTSDEN